MNKKEVKIVIACLCLMLAISSLGATDKENKVSLYMGPDGALAINIDSDSIFFRTALRTDIKYDFLNTNTGEKVYGPYVAFEYTTPTLTINDTRNVAHFGLGLGYNYAHIFENDMRLGGHVGYMHGKYAKTGLKYSALDFAVDYLYPINEDFDLQAKAGLFWRGNMFSGYLQLGGGYNF